MMVIIIPCRWAAVQTNEVLLDMESGTGRVYGYYGRLWLPAHRQFSAAQKGVTME
jgi:hypothetical protein